MGRKARGLTLAEIMIALGVASIALLTLIMFVSMIYRAAREGKSQAAASSLARKSLERLRTDGEYFKEAASEEGLTAIEEFTVDPGTGAVNFTVVTHCTPIEDTDERYYDAAVNVSWEEGRDREVHLQTVLPRP